ncbi:unnamed protein product [Gordionus sp. m RMFG-2023]
MTGNLCLTLSSNTYENPRSYEIVYPPLPPSNPLPQPTSPTDRLLLFPVKTETNKTYYGCDPKSLETNCTIDNCVGAVPCSNNTQIECYNNMCTCSAIWWLGEKIFDCNSKDAYAAPEFQPRKSGIIPAKIIGLFDYRLHYGCENVSELVDCYWEVCDTNTNNQNRVSRPNGGLEDINNGVCQGYPGAECYPNACKKCSAFWWFQYQKVDCDEEYGELKRRNTFERKERKGKERKGKERKGKERKGKERKGKERKGKERKGKERKGKERKGKERKGKERKGKERKGKERKGKERKGKERKGKERKGKERKGKERKGKERKGKERKGKERKGKERKGKERKGKERKGKERKGKERKGKERKGKERKGKERKGKERKGKERKGKERKGKERKGKERKGKERKGKERKGKERKGKERKGKERKGKERKGKERKGKERKGKERKGKERKGKERKGKERKGKERKGKERIGKERKSYGLNEIGCDGYTCNCDAKLPETTCYHDPCVNATCYLYPRAQCRSHNCFQCEARFYAGDREVKCV